VKTAQGKKNVESYYRHNIPIKYHEVAGRPLIDEEDMYVMLDGVTKVRWTEMVTRVRKWFEQCSNFKDFVSKWPA
jgi:hypothetical protein